MRHLNETAPFVGTPATVADDLARYVREGAIDRLVPQLQERGVYPAGYPGSRCGRIWVYDNHRRERRAATRYADDVLAAQERFG